MSVTGAPSPRYKHSSVWTGTEMIVWGRYASYFDSGKLGDGARYDPATDTWTSLNATGAPAPRYSHGAAWRRRQQSGGLAARARGGTGRSGGWIRSEREALRVRAPAFEAADRVDGR